MLQRRGLSAIYSDGHGSFFSGGFFNVKVNVFVVAGSAEPLEEAASYPCF